MAIYLGQKATAEGNLNDNIEWQGIFFLTICLHCIPHSVQVQTDRKLPIHRPTTVRTTLKEKHTSQDEQEDAKSEKYMFLEE